MQIPLQVTFEGSDPSEPVRVAIEREVERLEKHNRYIIGCHVAVIAPSHKHRHGSGYRVHISLTVSPHENVIVNRRADREDEAGRTYGPLAQTLPQVPFPGDCRWIQGLIIIPGEGSLHSSLVPGAHITSNS